MIEKHLSTSRELLNFLSPAAKQWRDGKWIYRGMNSSGYELIPSLYRQTENSFSIGKIMNSNMIEVISTHVKNFTSSHNLNIDNDKLVNIIKYLFYEITLLENFLSLANRNRLWIEETKIFKEQLGSDASNYLYYNLNRILEKYLLNINDKETNLDILFKFPREFTAIDYPVNIALAQHHGVPTRLLDWTYNPYIAAFFAAYESNSEDFGDICIWGYKINKDLSLGISFHENLLKYGLEFLHLQQGVFTEMIYNSTFYMEKGKWPSLDQYCEWRMQHYPDSYSINKDFVKVCLPKKKSGELLEILDKININQVSLMPSYDNIARSLKNSNSRLKKPQEQYGFRLD